MHSRSLSTDTNVAKLIKTRSSSVKHMAAASEVGSNSGAGDAPAAGQMSRSRKVSKSKVIGCKSLGSMPRFQPPISKKIGGGQVDSTVCRTIRKPARFAQQDTSTPIHLLGRSGLGNHGMATPKSVQQK